jgi:hypothetical protein
MSSSVAMTVMTKVRSTWVATLVYFYLTFHNLSEAAMGPEKPTSTGPCS